MKKKLIFFVLVTIIILTATGCFFNGDDNVGGESIDLSKTRIELNNNNFNYTGEEICPGFKVYQKDNILFDFSKEKEHADLIVTYENNVNVGKATIKVEPKSGSKAYSGFVKGYFVIRSVAQVANDADSLIKYLNDPNYQKVSLGSDIVIPEDASINISNLTVFNTDGYNLTNNGNIKINGQFNINNVKNRISTIINNGDVEFTDNVSTILNADKNTYFINTGKLTLLNKELNGNREITACLLSDTPILDKNGDKLFVKKDSSNYFFYRRPISEFEIIVSNDSTYTGEGIQPKVRILDNETQDEYYLVNNFDVTLQNNINAGTGTIKLTAKEKSKYFTGEITKEFTINKANIEINETEYDLLNEKLSNGNYNEITLIGNYPNEITVPENTTLIIKDSTLTPSIINNGTLKIINTKENEILNISRLKNNGLIELSGNNLVINSILDGIGKVKLNNDLFLSNSGDISNIKFETNSKIYYNELNQATGVNLTSGELVKREKFNNAKNLRINNNHLDYKSMFIEMNYTFVKNGTDLILPNDTYVFNIPSNMINAGEYKYTFEFLPISKEFYNKDEGVFYIDKTNITLNADNDFGTFLDTNNYDNITLTAETLLSNKRQYIIPKDTTINISAGAALYNNTYVEEGLIKSCLVLLGKIVNNGIYAEIGDRNLSLRPETEEDVEGVNVGTIENNGKVYFNEVTEANKAKIRDFGIGYPSVTGDMFLRKDMNECTTNIISDTCTFNKVNGLPDRANLIPKVGMVLNGSSLIEADNLTAKNSDFAVIGYNNRHITSKYNDTYALVTACYASEKVYGAKRVDYTINPGKASVSNFKELKDVLDDSANYDQLDDYICDWNEVIVTQNIQYTGTLHTSITVASNVNLRVGNHSMDLYSTEKDYLSHNFVCTMNNYGKIYTSCRTYDLDMEYVVKDKGKTIGEAHDLRDFKDYMIYDEIKLMTDLTTEENNKYIEINTNSNEAYHGKHCFTIDLNGHSIDKLLINSDGRPVTINGDSTSKIKDLYLEGMKNKIDYGITVYAIVLNNFTVDYLTYDTSYEEKYVELNNMQIKESKVHDVIEIPVEQA